MILHLVFAIFWLLVALALLIMPMINPHARWQFINTRTAIGAGLFMAGYFLLRWWMTRPRRTAPPAPSDDPVRPREESTERISEFILDKPDDQTRSGP